MPSLLGALKAKRFAGASFRNGTWWRALGASERLSYVVGYLDAVAVMKSAAIASITASPSGGVQDSAVSPEALANGLDAFYGDRLNRAVSLASAIHFVSRQIADPTADLSELLRKFRRV
jgi:hypothetical protein